MLMVQSNKKISDKLLLLIMVIQLILSIITNYFSMQVQSIFRKPKSLTDQFYVKESWSMHKCIVVQIDQIKLLLLLLLLLLLSLSSSLLLLSLLLKTLIIITSYFFLFV